MSRVVHDRLEVVLPQLISINQAGFVQGRSIIENVLLAQEIVTDIRKRGKPANVVIKLDMAKAYDRVSWSYLIKEVLSRALNAEFDNAEYVGYDMHKWSKNINHLAYADDTIIFASAEGESLKRIMKILQDYEAISGQLINKGKSSFYMHLNISGALSQQVEQITGFKRDQFPLKYLGCPIFHSRRKKVYYSDLIKKVKTSCKIGKENCTLLVEKQFLSIVSTKEEGKSRHWSSWDKVCLQNEEGGLGFRSLDDKKKPTEVQWKGGSQVWKKMIEARDQVDQQIWWEPRNGACDVWEDNWTKLGSLK
ncbi:uncharacterized protein LOC132601491 [Lycium barbarum]|uniref:uncharacterized protein LOC132601491 n=1 Tax=Lycium barbarum TaxID=112863 RepID=UPI00293F71FF|nr:uncharacterized protein LOC132601491 [Lycium barbarum]